MSHFPKTILSPDELQRYDRHILIPEFQLAGQLRLKESKVLVVGAGGLGSPILLYLAAAGIGTLGIAEADSIDLSNLQRQVLFSSDQVGLSKASIAANKINGLNPHVNVRIHEVFLDSDNALEVLKDYDVIIDGSDNFPTRYLVNDACIILGKPLVYGSIFQFEGQVSVFNLENPDGSFGPSYRDLFPEPPPPGMVPSCSEGGVLGVLPGIIGSMQANEAIKIITGIGETLSGRLFIYDALSFKTITLKVAKNTAVTKITELIDYDAFCGMKDNVDVRKGTKGQVTPRELKALLSSEEYFQLIDVRLPHEYQIADIGGDKMPLPRLDGFVDKIIRDGKVVIYCKTGTRAMQAITHLEEKYGLTNLHNLDGGIMAYRDKVDITIAKY
ncbi:UNVERIFIED_CONTAM: hypothetical protein GTU68_006948 [Idotea baltica]|nr:hypothetical protein [Idotea baltica]